MKAARAGHLCTVQFLISKGKLAVVSGLTLHLQFFICHRFNPKTLKNVNLCLKRLVIKM